MGMMDKMMQRKMNKMTKEEKMEMMQKMMPMMMEDMDPSDMMDNMHEMMPMMMENCLKSMSPEERRQMFLFCRNMLSELESKFNNNGTSP